MPAAAPPPPSSTDSTRGITLFGQALRARPARTLAVLFVEYGMFFAAVGLALALVVTRVPLRLLDGALGLRLRERFVNLIARLSPG